MGLPIASLYQQNQLQNLQTQLANLSQMMGQQAALSYQPQPAVQQQPVVLPQQQIQYVNGIDGARAYQLGPNSSAILMDSNGAVFYCVSTDANGVRSPIKIGKFTLEDESSLTADYVTKKDLEDLKGEIKKLLADGTQRNNHINAEKRGDNK